MNINPLQKKRIARISLAIFGIVLVLAGTTVANSACAFGSENLVKNADLENGATKPTSWQLNSYGENDAVFSYPVEGYKSSRGAKVAITKYVTGDAKWFPADVSVVPGKEYLFVEYFKATSVTELVARFTLKDKSYKYIKLESFIPSEDWQEYSRVLTPPENSVSLTLFHTLNSIGSLTVDDYFIGAFDPATNQTAFDQGYVSLTFDDGWITHYTEARSILNNAGVKGSFYIVTEKITNEASGRQAVAPDAEAGEHIAPTALVKSEQSLRNRVIRTFNKCSVDPSQLYVNKAQTIRLSKEGHEVSAHTHSHADLAALPIADAAREITDSKVELEKIGISPLETFVYPYGAYSPAVMQVAKDNGFIAARSVEEGYNTRSSNKYALKVQNITSTTTHEQVQAWINTAKENKEWLILVFHQIDRTGSPYSTTPQFLYDAVQYLKETNTPVITTREGVAKMK